jgi:hypothetical protein
MKYLPSLLFACALAALPVNAASVTGTHRSTGAGIHSSRSSRPGRSHGSRPQHHSSGHSRAPRSSRSHASAPRVGRGHSYSSRKHSTSPHAKRNSHGRTKRNEEAKDQFERQTGFPHGRPGYVVDHIIPLACGGADAPANMQWQTVAAGKAKDKVERKGC